MKQYKSIQYSKVLCKYSTVEYGTVQFNKAPLKSNNFF